MKKSIYTVELTVMVQEVNEIKVSHCLRIQIMRALGVTYPTVWSALQFKSSTKEANPIREYILLHGGTRMSRVICSILHFV